MALYAFWLFWLQTIKIKQNIKEEIIIKEIRDCVFGIFEITYADKNLNQFAATRFCEENRTSYAQFGLHVVGFRFR